MKNFQLNFITDKVKLRWFQILKELESTGICTTAQLIGMTNSTARTLVNDINYLREYFENVADIQSSKQGYSLNIHSSETYLEKKRAILEDEPLFIILEQIFFNELQSIYDWADYFHISESTMITYVKKIADQVKEFNITLELNPVNLIGSEADIRNFYFAFYYESDITPHTVFPSIATQEVVIKIVNLLERPNQKVSSFGYFSYLLYLSIERILCGCMVELDPELKDIVLNDPEFHRLSPAYSIVKDYFNIDLTQEEAIFIFSSVLCRRGIENPKQEKYFCERYNRWPLIIALTSSYYQMIKRNTHTQAHELILLESFFTSIKLRSLLSKSGNKNIQDTNEYAKTLFSNEYKKNRAFLEKNPSFHHLFSDDHLDDICASLTIFTESIKEKYWKNPTNIAFIFEGNEYISQHLEALVRKYLGGFQNIYFLRPNELCASYIENHEIDLLVTNYNEYLTFSSLGLECLLLKTVPDASDWKKLLNKIDPQLLQKFRTQH